MDTINLESGAFNSALNDRHLRELQKYETRYLFLPFLDASHPSLDGGAVPAGEIFALDAPRRHIPMRDLPMDVPASVVEHGLGPNKDIACYLDEPGPILSAILQDFRAQGAVEITALKGMQGAQFQRLKLNDIIFGSPRPATAAALRERMAHVLRQAKEQKTDASAKLAEIANTVLQSVAVCEPFCERVLQETHADMDTAKTGNADAKRRYDRRDLRAIEFIGAIPREQQMLAIANEQRQQAAALPAILQQMNEQNERWAQLAEGMMNTMNAQAEMLKVIAANAGANAPAQPAESGAKKAK
jgi:hypothetical protein